MKKYILIFFLIPFFGLAQLSQGLSEIYFETSVTAGSNKGVTSGALNTALGLKADLASPTLTGDPKAPTATAGDNDTSIATTAFVFNNARPYKVYTALVSQSGTSAPTATVLENTLGGTVVWSRVGTGSYRATLTGSFTSNKTVIFYTTQNGSADNRSLKGIVFPPDYIAYNSYNSSGTQADDQMLSSVIEIRVYP